MNLSLAKSMAEHAKLEEFKNQMQVMGEISAPMVSRADPYEDRS